MIACGHGGGDEGDGSTPGIAVDGLACRYPGEPRPALDGVDLVVPRGSLTVVMGASGAGKSTLARCLTRIVPCFVHAEVAGRIRLAGRDVAGRRVGELSGTIGMVFQDFEAQLFSSDVTQEVVFGLEQTGVPPDEMPERVRGALAAVGLAGFEERDPGTLSGGEKQRLAIAGLVAMRPHLMVLDEPTTDLDPAGRAEILATLAALRRDGMALLLIEHDVGAAAQADRLVLLREGRVIAAGPPREVLAGVAATEAAGVRPSDVARVFAALGIPDPPLDVDEAAARLRAAGLVPGVARGHGGAPKGGTTSFGAAASPVGRTPRPPPAPLLAIRDLVHRYPDGREALRGVTLEVARGEVLAVVGRNGSGKTTLARHLNGLLRPTAGSVRLDGRDVAGMRLEEIAQRVGYVFQDPDHQLFASTVEEEVAFGPRNLRLGPAAVLERVDEALAAVGLDVRDADPFLLDKGTRQRLAVAAVLALRPDVLVLDEPTTGLDWHEQQRMVRLLAGLEARGCTVVLVTHTPWVVAEHARRVVLLADGRVCYDGPVRGFFADPERVALARFRAPDVTRLGQAFGCTALSVDELVAAIRGRGR